MAWRRRESGGKVRRRHGSRAMGAPGRRRAGCGSGLRRRRMSSSCASTPEPGRRPSRVGERRAPGSERLARAASGRSGSACRRRRTTRCGRRPPRGSRSGIGVTRGCGIRKAARRRRKSASCSRGARLVGMRARRCGAAVCWPRRKTRRANSSRCRATSRRRATSPRRRSGWGGNMASGLRYGIGSGWRRKGSAVSSPWPAAPSRSRASSRWSTGEPVEIPSSWSERA